MPFVRHAFRSLSANFLKLSLFVFALVAALVGVLGTPDKIKDGLGSSGLYTQAVESALDQTAKQTRRDDNSLPLDRPEIRAAAREAFSEDRLRGWAESVIDGMYGWLDGTTPEPQFRIDLREARQSFVREVADYAGERLEGLPACSMQQNIALSQQDVDPFRVECRPQISIGAEKKRLIAELDKNQDFLEDAVITQDDLTGENGAVFDGQASQAPEIFQFIKRLPVIVLLIVAGSAAGLILLSESQRSGIRRAAIIVLGTGLFLFISTLLFTFLFNQSNRPGGAISNLIDLDDASLQTALFTVVRGLHGAFNGIIITVAIIYSLIGGGTLIALHFVKDKAEAGKQKAVGPTIKKSGLLGPRKPRS